MGTSMRYDARRTEPQRGKERVRQQPAGERYGDGRTRQRNGATGKEIGQLIDRGSNWDGLVEAKCRDDTKDCQHGRIHAQIAELIRRIDSCQRW